MSVIEEIAAERRRQVEVECWTPKHDDAEHYDGELGRAAVAYAMGGMKVYQLPMWLARDMKEIREAIWPWERWEFKLKGPRRNLIRAAALLVAEIERMDRAATPSDKENAG